MATPQFQRGSRSTTPARNAETDCQSMSPPTIKAGCRCFEPGPGAPAGQLSLVDVGREEIPREHIWLADAGYLGTQATLPPMNLAGGEPSDHDQQTSSIRSIVERVIAHPRNSALITIDA